MSFLQLRSSNSITGDINFQIIYEYICTSPCVCSAVEAFAIGTRLGEKIIFVGCSMGGTLVTWLMAQDWARPRLHSAVLVSPGYGVQFPYWKFLKHMFHYMPTFCVAQVLSLIKGGSHYKIDCRNEMQKKYWTSEYPFKCFDIVFELFYDVGSGATACLPTAHQY